MPDVAWYVTQWDITIIIFSPLGVETPRGEVMCSFWKNLRAQLHWKEDEEFWMTGLMCFWGSILLQTFCDRSQTLSFCDIEVPEQNKKTEKIYIEVYLLIKINFEQALRY